MLHGIPLGVKDIFDTADLPTECGSPIYQGRRPGADADVVATLRALGAIVLGKTVTTEFAYFHPGPTRNPRDLERTPGGSSSGSAAAVADGMVELALGSQTAGSTTRPAAYCGVAGLATSVGSFSTAGMCPLSPSLDTLGLFAPTVTQLAAFHDALTAPPEPRRPPGTEQLNLLVCDAARLAELDPEMAVVFDDLRERLVASGAQLTELGLVDECLELGRDHATIMAREAFLSRTEQRELLSDALRELLESGQHTAEGEYRAALTRVAAHRDKFARLLAAHDAILLPAATGPAPVGTATGDPVLSRPWQAMGLPAVTLPGLTTQDGLPLGVQLVGAPGQDRQLLSVALAIQPAMGQVRCTTAD